MTTNVYLTPELEGFARSCVASGRYNNVSEVVRAALRLLQDDEERRAAFMRSLEEAEAEAERDGWVTAEEALASMDEIIERGGSATAVTRAILAPRARRELDRAAAWIARDSLAAAVNLRVAVEEALKLIGEYPDVGAIRPDVAKPPLRLWRIRGFPYLMIYRPISPRPRVIRIVHGSRDLPEVLRDLEPS